MDNRSVFIETSAAVAEYRKELRQVTSSLHKIGELDLFFEKSLLVSINDGWGYTAFLEMLCEELAPYYEEPAEMIQHCKYPELFDKPTVEMWNRKDKDVARLSEKVIDKNSFAILTCDLTECMDDLSNPFLIKGLKKIVKISKRVLVVFRVYHMEEKERKNLQSKFEKFFPIRAIDIAPFSREEMYEYVKEKLCSGGFQLEAGAEVLLKKWVQEREETICSEGHLMLDQMIGELIYQKALCDVEDMGENNMDTCVTKENVQSMFATAEKEQDGYELLNNLIGMAELKAKVREIVAQIKLQKELTEQGKDIGRPSMHMMFLGNPGTGKTTLARIVAQILKQEGLLRKNEVLETTGNYFVEGLVSELMEKMRNTCKDARGKVLFIDEAYGMSVGHSKGNVADDVLPILVEQMENYRDDMCVIFAGYEEEMEAFLKRNSGLKSRIPHILRFPNYNREELQEIFFQMVEGSFEYEEELKETLREYMYSIPEEAFSSKEFSNARFMRNLYERVWGKTAYRVSFDEDKEIVLKDIDMRAALEEEMFSSMVDTGTEKKIGFSM